MAIAFDAVSSVTSGSAGSRSVSHTTSGSDRVLIAYLLLGAGDVTSSYTSVAATYNGVSMTNWASETGSVSNQRRVEAFRLVNPASGANTLAATWSGGGNEAYWIGVSYTGVDQTTPLDVTGSNEGSGAGTSLTTSLTTTVDNCYLTGGIFLRHDGSPTFSSGTDRFSDLVGAVSDRAVTTAGAYSATFTFSDPGSGNERVMAAAALKPAADVATGSSRRRMLVGIGM